MKLKKIIKSTPILSSIRTAYRRHKAKYNYKRARRMADEAFATTGKRHIVIMMDTGKLAIYSRETFRKHKIKGYTPSLKDCKVYDLLRSCVYHTPTIGGNRLSDREAEIRKNQYIAAYASR